MPTVRLNREMEQKIDSIADQKETTRSDVIREALEEYITRHEMTTRPYDLGKHIFGLRGSGESDLSTTYKSRLKSKIHEKHTH